MTILEIKKSRIKYLVSLSGWKNVILVYYWYFHRTYGKHAIFIDKYINNYNNYYYYVLYQYNCIDINEIKWNLKYWT